MKEFPLGRVDLVENCALSGKTIKSVEYDNFDAEITINFTDGTRLFIETDMGNDSLEVYLKEDVKI